MLKRNYSNDDGPGANVINWLLEENQPSVRYYTMTDLLDMSEKDGEVKRAKSLIPYSGWGHDIMKTQKPEGYWEAHEPRSPREWFNFLRFPLFRSSIWRGIILSDMGFTKSEPGVQRFSEQVFRHMLSLGSPLNIFTEEVCIVGNVAAMMSRFGYGDDRRIRKLYDWMIEDQREDGGWNCSQGKPGTLDCWEALSALSTVPKAGRTAAIKRAIERGAEFYLERNLFKEGARYSPWFRFHYPTHYFYDILVGLDVLTGLGYAGDRRLQPALQTLYSKRRKDWTWLLDRSHPDEVPHDTRRNTRPLTLELPGMPSKWITLKAMRVLKRVEEAN